MRNILEMDQYMFRKNHASVSQRIFSLLSSGNHVFQFGYVRCEGTLFTTGMTSEQRKVCNESIHVRCEGPYLPLG